MLIYIIIFTWLVILSFRVWDKVDTDSFFNEAGKRVKLEKELMNKGIIDNIQ
jgi:hypothetical protein